MPQDGLKSAVYRSFLTCDDPKGVVECKTIRISKSNSEREEKKSEKQISQKNLKASSGYKEEKKETVSKGCTEDAYKPSSLQLMEVSKGAQKLNQVVDSWSTGISLEKKSKDIAKDLLKGAIDLHESLAMLGKLQEASQYMAKLKKKRKVKDEGANLDGRGIERTKSDRYEYTNSVKEFQKPRHSVDGYPRDCYDELREVIRESFARQNLLPKNHSKEIHYDLRKSGEENLHFGSRKSLEEKDHFHQRKLGVERSHIDRRKFDNASDFPSTSSSQSSVFHSNEFASSSCSPSKVHQEKPKGSNLIARLMGLEESPHKLLQSSPRKPLEKDRILNQRRPVFEIDLPMGRKPQIPFTKVDPERRTLEEIIETMQLKGLFKSKCQDGSRRKSYGDLSSPGKLFSDDGPPIVLIKPKHYPGPQAEDFPTCKCKYEGKVADIDVTFEKWKIEEGISPMAAGQQQNRKAQSFTVQNEVLSAKSASERTGTHKVSKVPGEALADPIDKDIKVQETVTVTPARKKASLPRNSAMQKKEAIEKKVEKGQKYAPDRRKSADLQNCKGRDASKSLDQGKFNSAKLRKPERRSDQSKSQDIQQENATSKRITLPLLDRSSRRKRKEGQSVRSSTSTTDENTRVEDEMRMTNVACGNGNTAVEMEVTTLEQLPADETKEILEDNIQGDGYENEIPDKSAVLSIKSGRDGNEEDANFCIYDDHDENHRNRGSRFTTKNILLSNVSFVSHAEELFKTNAWQPLLLNTTVNLHDSGVVDQKLLLECAIELLERKRSQSSLAADILLQSSAKKSKIQFSLDKLVGEISDGIEALKSYTSFPQESILVDTVHKVLARDLRCEASGTWVAGWKTGFTSDEVEQVVVDIEKVVLGGIIDDVLVDFRL